MARRAGSGGSSEEEVGEEQSFVKTEGPPGMIRTS